MCGVEDGLNSSDSQSSPVESTPQILQILLTLASTPKGALALLNAKSWPRLLEAVPELSLALDVVKYTFVTAALQNIEQSQFWRKLDNTISTLINTFEPANDATQFFECLNQILTVSPKRASSVSA